MVDQEQEDAETATSDLIIPEIAALPTVFVAPSEKENPATFRLFHCQSSQGIRT